MFVHHRAEDRGRTRAGWLDSWHSFSFGDFVDTDRLGFGPLRVINEDFVQPNSGFGLHPHRDMEIITIVLEGAVEHGDSLGNRELLGADEIQRMSAGTGIEHFERNSSASVPAHFLQIWIKPDRKGHQPRYEQWKIPALPPSGFDWLVGPADSGAMIPIHQDARMALGTAPADGPIRYVPPEGRRTWIQAVDGEFLVNDTPMRGGDAVATDESAPLVIASNTGHRFLLFDLP